MILKNKKGQAKKKKFIIALIIAAIAFIIAVIVSNSSVLVFARDTICRASVEADLGNSVGEILNEIDLSRMEEFIRAFSPGQLTVFGSASAAERIQMVLSGQISINYSGFFLYLLEMIGISVLEFLPLMLAILAVAIAINLIHSLKGKFAKESVGKIVSFAGVALVSAMLAITVVAVIGSANGLIGGLNRQMSIVFPILLTMMAAAGGASSAAIYQPAVAILGGGIMSILTTVILPVFVVANALTIVGNLSEGLQLKKMSGFFTSSSKWVLGAAFFLFIAFLSVQGITASIYDGVSVRTARFAIGRFVPIIGGYLQEGFSLVMAGSVLIKNAVGITAVVILFLTAIPVISSTVIFSLSLKLTAAVAEPLGDKRISNILTGVSKNMTILIATIIGAVFLYFVFLMLVIATGNPAL